MLQPHWARSARHAASSGRPSQVFQCLLLCIVGRVDGWRDVVLENALPWALSFSGGGGLMKIRLASRSLRRLMAALTPPSM
jgi:hypothetical protein